MLVIFLRYKSGWSALRLICKCFRGIIDVLTKHWYLSGSLNTPFDVFVMYSKRTNVGGWLFVYKDGGYHLHLTPTKELLRSTPCDLTLMSLTSYLYHLYRKKMVAVTCQSVSLIYSCVIYWPRCQTLPSVSCDSLWQILKHWHLCQPYTSVSATYFLCQTSRSVLAI